ncbi:hypothetical protein FS837_009516 [Tulasnella sp. UAMH 9824]|nr:hypothetical protein FS837_009516 [Tulasnella sp. UAMH 9824]
MKQVASMLDLTFEIDGLDMLWIRFYVIDVTISSISAGSKVSPVNAGSRRAITPYDITAAFGLERFTLRKPSAVQPVFSSALNLLPPFIKSIPGGLQFLLKEIPYKISSLITTNAIATPSLDSLWPSSGDPSLVTFNYRGGIDKISRLPDEILATLLGLALPEVDVTICFPAPGVCRSYVMGLYALRRVSASWRDLVDGTPNLWFIVSSTTPIDIIAVCLSRSKACPILIHYENDGEWGDYGDSEDSEAQEAMKERTSFLQFSRLTIPHRHRWAILWLKAASSLVFDQLKETVPLLHTVKLDSAGKTAPPWLNPATSSETTLGVDIKTLRHVELRGGPAAWGWARFSGLRIWKLKELVGDGLTTQHILDVLRESPLLEVLVMERLRVQIFPDHTVHAPISLLRLMRITFRWCKGDFVNHVLRHIQVPVELIKEVSIAVRDWGSLQQIGLLTDGLASWSPLLRRAHRTCEFGTPRHIQLDKEDYKA